MSRSRARRRLVKAAIGAVFAFALTFVGPAAVAAAATPTGIIGGGQSADGIIGGGK